MFEFLGFTTVEFEHLLLIGVRISALLLTLPLFSAPLVTPRIRIVISICLAIIVFQIVPAPDNLPVDIMLLGFFAAQELMIGLLMGFTATILFESLKLSGFMIGRMMSLSMMTLIDPTTSENSQLIGQLKYYVAMLLLFTFYGHHFFLQTIFDSFYFMPVTKIHYSASFLPEFLKMFSYIFVAGIKIGAPIFAALFLERVLLALFAKVTPEIQILIVAMPLAILIGFYFLSIYWPYFSYIFLKIFNSFKLDYLELFKLLGTQR